MFLDQRKFVFVQSPRFSQNLIGNFQFAQVVQQPAGNDQFHFMLGHPQLARQHPGIQSDVGTVCERCVIVIQNAEQIACGKVFSGNQAGRDSAELARSIDRFVFIVVGKTSLQHIENDFVESCGTL